MYPYMICINGIYIRLAELLNFARKCAAIWWRDTVKFSLRNSIKVTFIANLFTHSWKKNHFSYASFKELEIIVFKLKVITNVNVMSFTA